MKMILRSLTKDATLKEFNFYLKLIKVLFQKIRKIYKINKKKWLSKVKSVPKINFDQENSQLKNLIRKII